MLTALGQVNADLWTSLSFVSVSFPWISFGSLLHKGYSTKWHGLAVGCSGPSSEMWPPFWHFASRSGPGGCRSSPNLRLDILARLIMNFMACDARSKTISGNISTLVFKTIGGDIVTLGDAPLRLQVSVVSGKVLLFATFRPPSQWQRWMSFSKRVAASSFSPGWWRTCHTFIAAAVFPWAAPLQSQSYNTSTDSLRPHLFLEVLGYRSHLN